MGVKLGLRISILSLIIFYVYYNVANIIQKNYIKNNDKFFLKKEYDLKGRQLLEVIS